MSEKLLNPKAIKIKDVFGRNCKVNEETILEYAKTCIDERFKAGEALISSAVTRSYIKTLIGEYQREVFYVIWLNNQNQVLKHRILFFGTIDGATVSPRELVKDGLECNAAACIFAHNHPSGKSQPSQADIGLTRRLKNALALIDIRTLDHFVVGNDVSSLAEMGLI